MSRLSNSGGRIGRQDAKTPREERRGQRRPLGVGAGVVVLVLGVTGCGGGVPLLYPARTLERGDIRLAGGTSGSVLVGSLANAVSTAHTEAVAPPAPGPPRDDATSPVVAKGALVLAAVAPGMAPYVSARVGVGERFEAGVTYTGRAAHLDVRRSFDWGATSLSIGLGAEIPLYGDADSATLPGFDLAAIHGFGVDVPVLIGWESTARAYMLWAGVRGGWDHVGVASPAPDGPNEGEGALSLSADRFYGGGVVGLAGGFRHVHVALELDLAYESVAGTFAGTTTTIQGVSVAPAAALWWTF